MIKRIPSMLNRQLFKRQNKQAVSKKQNSENLSRWMIDKQFDFCYGHRVWSQELNKDYCSSGDFNCKCRFLHGHQGEIHVYVEADELERGMVVDFKMLGWFKDFIDDNLDHKFIIDLEDPWFAQILNAVPVFAKPESVGETVMLKCLSATQPLNTKEGREIPAVPVYVPGTTKLAGYSLDVSDMSGPEREFYESFFLVNFLPTSENLTKWMFECVKTKMDLIGVQTAKVTLNETPKSRAEYSVKK